VENVTLIDGNSFRAQSLFGLLLAGGESRRMGRPKANIPFEGSPMYERGLRTLKGICERTFVSCRGNSIAALREHDHVADIYPSNGPMTGILSALETYQGVSWMVIPVDMPRLTSEFLRRNLILNRHSGGNATVIRVGNKRAIQPLVAIYEPSSLPFMQDAFERKSYSVKEVLTRMNVHYVDLEDSEILLNLNRTEDWPEDGRSK